MYVTSVLYGCCICCKRMFQLFHLVSLCCSRCCSPRALTRGHARAARTHPALLISVMQASSNSRMCTQRAVNAQMAEHSLVKVHAHAECQSQPAPNGPSTTRLGPPRWSMQPVTPNVNTGTDAVLPSSLACSWIGSRSWTGSTHMLSCVVTAASHVDLRARRAKHAGV
jgi:hypothetical protein